MSNTSLIVEDVFIKLDKEGELFKDFVLGLFELRGEGKEGRCRKNLLTVLEDERDGFFLRVGADSG